MEQNKSTSLRFSNQKTKLLPRDISESLGKLPPSALDLEEAVLGAVMLEKDALTEVIEFLLPEHFYSEAHREIYQAITNLFKNTHPVDMLTVKNQLERDGKIELVGGAYYLAELTSKVSSAANMGFYARVITEMAIKRELIQIASAVHQDAYEDTTDVFDLLESTQGKLDKVSVSNFKGGAVSAAVLYQETIKYLYESRNDHGITGVPTGYYELDRVSGGWQKPDLIILAGRPGMGKSAMAGELIKNAAIMFKKPVALFSLEMSSRQFMQRMIASEAEVDLERIVRNNTTDMEINSIADKTKRIHDAPIFIDDTPAISTLELRAKARKLKHEHKIEMIVVDYLQLMRGDKNGNREQEIASISRALKSLAKELEIPIIAISALSRGVETRGGDKKPQLSDLRESGQIESDADVIIFLYRAEYYKIAVDEQGNSTQNIIEAIAAKNRNGKTGSILLKFIGKYAKIMDLNQMPLPGPLDHKIVDFSKSRLVEKDEFDDDLDPLK